VCGQPSFHTDGVYEERGSDSFERVGCSEGMILGGFGGDGKECRIGNCVNSVLGVGDGDGKGWRCGISMTYAEGSSWVAFEARDVVYFGGPHDEALLDEESDSDGDGDGDGDDDDETHDEALLDKLLDKEIDALFDKEIDGDIIVPNEKKDPSKEKDDDDITHKNEDEPKENDGDIVQPPNEKKDGDGQSKEKDDGDEKPPKKEDGDDAKYKENDVESNKHPQNEAIQLDVSDGIIDIVVGSSHNEEEEELRPKEEKDGDDGQQPETKDGDIGGSHEEAVVQPNVNDPVAEGIEESLDEELQPKSNGGDGQPKVNDGDIGGSHGVEKLQPKKEDGDISESHNEALPVNNNEDNTNGRITPPRSLRTHVVSTNHNSNINDDQDADGDYYYEDESLVNNKDDGSNDDRYSNEMFDPFELTDFSNNSKNKSIKTTEELQHTFLDEVKLASMQQQPHHPNPNLSASNQRFTLSFGCQTSITGLFHTQLADGIMGLENSETSFWNQMYLEGVIASRAFSLCFVNTKDAERDGTEAGILTLGGVDERLNHWNNHNAERGMRYARNWKQRGWFEVFVKAVYLRMPPIATMVRHNGDDDDGENALEGTYSKTLLLNIDVTKINDVGIVIDSGTTESFLPSHIAGPLKTAFEKLTGETYREEYTRELFGGVGNVEGNVDDYFPTILLQLESAPPLHDDGDGTTRKSQEDEIEWKDPDGRVLPGFTGYLDETSPHDPLFEIPPRKYLKYYSKTNMYRNGLHLSEQAGIGIIGANAMDGHNILFDAENGRIGFAESNCDYGDLIER